MAEYILKILRSQLMVIKSIANDPLCDLLYETMGEEVDAIRDRRFFSLPFIENKECSVGE